MNFIGISLARGHWFESSIAHIVIQGLRILASIYHNQIQDRLFETVILLQLGQDLA